MGRILETDLPREHYDVFEVTQITRGTPLESAVAADLVSIAPGRASEVHRHNEAETVLLILDGAGIVLVGESSPRRRTWLKSCSTWVSCSCCKTPCFERFAEPGRAGGAGGCGPPVARPRRSE